MAYWDRREYPQNPNRGTMFARQSGYNQNQNQGFRYRNRSSQNFMQGNAGGYWEPQYGNQGIWVYYPNPQYLYQGPQGQYLAPQFRNQRFQSNIQASQQRNQAQPKRNQSGQSQNQSGQGNYQGTLPQYRNTLNPNEGPWIGYGPKRKPRSDEQIKDKICQVMTKHGHLDAHDITVDVNNGIVTLKGSVPNRQQKILARNIAGSVNDVKDVNNFLNVQNKPNGQAAKGAWKVISSGTIREHMVVQGKDGGPVGKVKKLLHDSFVVNRPLARDLEVPYDAIDKIEIDEVVILKVKNDQVGQQGWQKA